MIEYVEMDLQHNPLTNFDEWINDALQTVQKHSDSGKVHAKTFMNVHGHAVIAFSDAPWTEEKLAGLEQHMEERA